MKNRCFSDEPKTHSLFVPSGREVREWPSQSLGASKANWLEDFGNTLWKQPVQMTVLVKMTPAESQALLDAQATAKSVDARLSLLESTFSDVWKSVWKRSREDYEKFQSWTSEWQSATQFESIANRIANHESYRKIIGMGRKAVPMILSELEKEPHHWFIALQSILDIDPTPDDDQGDIEAMSKAWITWGKENGIEW